MKVTFLLPVAWHVRYHKRITALEGLGVQPTILAFEREYYPGRPWAGGYTSLGRLKHRQYLQRLIPLLAAVPAVRAAAKDSQAIYVFGLDMLLLAWLVNPVLVGQPKIIYEVGDIRQVLTGSSPLARGLRAVERLLLRRVTLLVVTSEAFVQGYYQGIQGLSNLPYQVIENKIDTNLIPSSQDPITREEWDGRLRIGYFGVLRDPRSWEVLQRAAAEGKGRVSVYMRGIPMGLEGLETEAAHTSQIVYDGPYVSPDDLPAMYGRVDMVWACRPYQGPETGNWRWARSNSFYESCFFGKPMFVLTGTEDGRIVEELGLGACLNLVDAEASVERILRVAKADLDKWQANLHRVPKEKFIYSGEHERLMEAILETVSAAS